MVTTSELLRLASELNEAVIAFRENSVIGKSVFRSLDRAILVADAADRLTGPLLEFINDQPQIQLELSPTELWRVTHERSGGDTAVWCKTFSEKEARHEYDALTVVGPKLRNVNLQRLWAARKSEWRTVESSDQPAEGNSL